MNNPSIKTTLNKDGERVVRLKYWAVGLYYASVAMLAVARWAVRLSESWMITALTKGVK